MPAGSAEVETNLIGPMVVTQRARLAAGAERKRTS
jgi:hypothetical protein